MNKDERIKRIKELLQEYNEHKSLGDQEAAIETLKQIQKLQEALGAENGL